MNQKEKKFSTSSEKKFRRPLVNRIVFSIKKFFGFALPDTFVLNDTIVYELAFVLNNKPYYWVADQTSVPAYRALAALTIYQEMEMGVDKAYLIKHSDEVDAILAKQRPSIKELARLQTLHKNLKERAQLMVLPDYVYKLASVVFLAENESPLGYDFEFNAKKIEEFRKDAGVAFFLTTPIKNLIPFLKLPRGDIRQYLKVTEEIEKMHQEILNDRTK